MGYVGATKVKPNLAELFFRSFASKSQKKASLQFVPTEYSNIAIDDENFLFVLFRQLTARRFQRIYNQETVRLNPRKKT